MAQRRLHPVAAGGAQKAAAEIQADQTAGQSESGRGGMMPYLRALWFPALPGLALLCFGPGVCGKADQTAVQGERADLLVVQCAPDRKRFIQAFVSCFPQNRK